MGGLAGQPALKILHALRMDVVPGSIRFNCPYFFSNAQRVRPDICIEMVVLKPSPLERPLCSLRCKCHGLTHIRAQRANRTVELDGKFVLIMVLCMRLSRPIDLEPYPENILDRVK